MAAFANLDWFTITALGLILAVICFLAVLWSRREWKSRKIRVGVFLEREYRNKQNEKDKEDTLEWPQRKE